MLTALLLCLVGSPLPAALPDELLPETPEGWRYERLDLPLSFAPGLPYRGFEEIRFAPGMFDAEAAGYWSYALALRLNEPAEMAASELEAFLTAYYAGLCEAVLTSRDLEFDPASVRVAVEDHGSILVANVDLIDAFVTNEPLRLRLELAVFQSPSSTEIMGIGSPSALDSEVWEKLRDMQSRWRAARPAEVFLNHLYFSPDAETYEALRSAPFLKEGFAAHEERTTTRPDITYSGFYVYGQDTYFEFLKPASDGAADGVGETGVAFGLEQRGGSKQWEATLKAEEVRTFAGPTSRGHGSETVPWFDALGVERAHQKSELQLFSLEYDERFLGAWHEELAPAHGGICRRQILERYAAKLDQSVVYASGLLENVTEVYLSLDERERARFSAVARASGYERSASGGAATWQGPQVRFVIQPSQAPGGVTGFKAELRSEVEKQTLRLGRASLSVQGTSLIFRLPR